MSNSINQSPKNGFRTKRINLNARSLATLLRSTRLKNEITIEQAEQSTCIPAKYLLALEDGKYELLPAEAYNVGYVKNYAQFLKLNVEKVLDLYREERSRTNVYASKKSTVQLNPRKMNDWQFLITPKVLAVVGTLLVFGSLITYIGLQVNKFAQPPELVITNVPFEFTSSDDLVTLQGRTAAGSVVTINQEPVTVSSSGSFSEKVQLTPGVNEIVVQSQNRAQRSTQAVIKALYRPDLARAQ